MGDYGEARKIAPGEVGNKAGHSKFVSAAIAAGSVMGGFSVKRIHRNGWQAKAVIRDITTIWRCNVVTATFRVTRGIEGEVG